MAKRKHDPEEKQQCYICSATTHPFGYILKGEAQVCSKKCDDQYHAERWHGFFDQDFSDLSEAA